MEQGKEKPAAGSSLPVPLVQYTQKYEGFRQVYDIQKFFDIFSVSVVFFLRPTCHHCIGL